MARLREQDLRAILGPDFARLLQDEAHLKPVTPQEKENARRKQVQSIAELRLTLAGVIVAGGGLIFGSFMNHTGFDIQAMCGAAGVAAGLVGLGYTIVKRRALTSAAYLAATAPSAAE